MTPSRPPVPYFGGKISLAPQIAELLPAHGHYVEPYGGSLAVLLAKPPAPHETVNDLDRRLIAFWRVLRDRPQDLERVCALTPHARAEYEACDQPAEDELEAARRVFVQLTQGRGRMLRETGWRRYVATGGSRTGMPAYLNGYVGRIAAAAQRLAHVSIECAPALEMVERYGSTPDALLYVDPPYLGSARASDRSRYVHEMASEPEHRALAEALRRARAAVVVSGYPCDLYDELFAGWDRLSFAASTGHGGAVRNRTEVLWSNRPLGAQPTLDGLGTEVDWC